jgi:hypothetical protein
METVTHIKQICVETDNEWFLTHDFPKIALCDLQLKSKLEKENIFTFDERVCICQTNTGRDTCISCHIELERHDEFDKLDLNKHCNNIYDYETECFTKSIWIIPDKIEGEIPGFMLIKCCGNGIGLDEGFTHSLEFACVRPKFRKKGILKNMVNRIPNEWNIWLEANSVDIENVENIWEKCGFIYHTTIDEALIYKKSAL